MKKRHFACIIVTLLTVVINVQAQEEGNKGLINSYLYGWEYNIKAGLNISGASFIPLPKEMRKIDSYTPGIAVAIEGNATKRFDEKEKWGLTLDLRLKNKNMTTGATVKDHGMRITNTNGGELAGFWAGRVKTKVKNSHLTISVLVNYHTSKRWILSVGPYFSYLLEGNLSGHVYEEHLHTSDQTGSKAGFTGESATTYDFSNDLKKFRWSMQFGGEWKAFKHLTMHADVTWGSDNIFQKNSDAITFNMYPIRLNSGFGYVF